ncbi:hypothetical protein U1Q18_015013, partial [Sarracenia purpurea var. burkii]
DDTATIRAGVPGKIGVVSDSRRKISAVSEHNIRSRNQVLFVLKSDEDHPGFELGETVVENVATVQWGNEGGLGLGLGGGGVIPEQSTSMLPNRWERSPEQPISVASISGDVAAVILSGRCRC